MPQRFQCAAFPASSLLRNLFTLVLLWCASTSAGASAEWLAICSKCVNPTIFSLIGHDTAKAVAQARITRAEIEGWCTNWQPGDAGCIKQGLLDHDLRKVYSAVWCRGGCCARRKAHALRHIDPRCRRP